MGLAPAHPDTRAIAERLRRAALRRRGQREQDRRPTLRLAGHGREDVPRLRTPQATPEPTVDAPVHQQIRSASDPRWMLAVRTAAALQGSILPPEKREKLVALGRSMGLSPFDANLVIAIVQDQARRGVLADYCPQAAAAQLAMVPAPRRLRPGAWLPASVSATHTAVAAAALLTLQALLLWLLIR